MKHKVSIIIPAYNAEKYIRQCISSVLLQDYPNIEVIVINDGSTDGTLDIIKQFKDVFLINQNNSGVSAARNAGLRAATGDYIAFLDADDYWLPGKITTQVEFLDNNPTFALHCTNLDRTDAPGVPILAVNSGWIFNKMIESSELCTDTVMIRKTTIDCVGFFDETLSVGEDYDYWLRISSRCKCHVSADIYATYRIHNASATHKFFAVDHSHQIFINVKCNPELYQINSHGVSKRMINDKISNLSAQHSYTCRIHCKFLPAIKSALIGISYNVSNKFAWKELIASLILRRATS